MNEWLWVFIGLMLVYGAVNGWFAHVDVAPIVSQAKICIMNGNQTVLNVTGCG